MNAYEISKGVDAPSVFAADLKGVRAVVRTLPREMRDDARVYLRDFPHDKAAFVRLLNGGPVEGTIKRRWRPGLRGGKLIELDLGEEQ